MTAKTLVGSLLVVAALSGCGAEFDGGGENGPIAPAGDTPPLIRELAGATYFGVFAEPVTLVDGRWEGAPYVDGGASRPSAGLVEDFVLFGDLDGDDRDEAAVLLWESSGGSGTREYLAVMDRVEGEIVNLGTALVGDRVQIRTGSISDRTLSLELVQAGPGDAACCPTEKAVIEWRIRDGDLQRISTRITGTLSLADLAGPGWKLAKLGHETVVPGEPEITIDFDGDKVAGSAGCNRYFGTAASTRPGNLAFSAMGTTMMACPEISMDRERRYLRALATGASYGFSAGRLVIGCDPEDGPVRLVFTPAKPLSPAATTP